MTRWATRPCTGALLGGATGLLMPWVIGGQVGQCVQIEGVQGLRVALQRPGWGLGFGQKRNE